MRLAQRAGLVRLNHIAIDGTKIKANASKHSAMSYQYMLKEEERLKEEIEQYLREVEETDVAEDRKFGKRCLGDELPEHLRDPKKRLEAIRRAKAELEAEAVDAETQIAVAVELSNQEARAPHLIPVLDQVEQNAGCRPKEVSADAGYFSERNLEELSWRQIEALIPPDKIKHSQWRNAPSPKGRIPKNITLNDRLRRKLRTKKGRDRYKLRQTSVEPVLRQIKERQGLRQFLLRRLAKVRSSWRFECAVHNLIKLFRAGIRFRPAFSGI